MKMAASRLAQLTVAAAERDLLLAKLNQLLGEAGVIEPESPVDIAALIWLADHLRGYIQSRRTHRVESC